MQVLAAKLEEVPAGGGSQPAAQRTLSLSCGSGAPVVSSAMWLCGHVAILNFVRLARSVGTDRAGAGVGIGTWLGGRDPFIRNEHFQLFKFPYQKTNDQFIFVGSY